MALHTSAQARVVGSNAPAAMNLRARRSAPHTPVAAVLRAPTVAGRAGRDNAATSRAGARLSRSALKGVFRSSSRSRAGSELSATKHKNKPEAEVEADEKREPTAAKDPAPKESPTKESNSKASTKKDELLKVLEKSGMDNKAAKQILNVWKEVGIESSDDLRKLLRRRTGTAIGVVAFQSLLDAAASYFSVSAGGFFYVTGGGSILSSVLGTVSYGFGVYYALNVLLGLVLIISMLASSMAFGSDADALLSAVQELGAGGNAKQLDVVAKAKEAINMVKIVQSLNQVSDILKGTGTDSKSTLDNLGSYLTLSRAEKEGFSPEKYGLSETEAARIAAKFCKFDVNDDGVLELSEMQKLFADFDVELSPEEASAALKVLDKRQSGTIEFDEFVEWYCNKIPESVSAQ